MKFELHITCSKDIDNLSINFSDGTSVVTESKPKEIKENSQEQTKQKVAKDSRRKLESYLDTETDFSISQEVVQKPIIQEVNRPVNVSDELQNLDL